MLAKLGMGCALGLVFVLGCAKSDPAVVPTAAVEQAEPALTAAPEAAPEPAEIAQAEATETEGPMLIPIEQTAAASDETPEAKASTKDKEEEEEEDEESPAKLEAKLLAKLTKQPNDTDTLLKLASLRQEQAETTESGDLDYSKLIESAEFIRRALKADKNLIDDDNVKGFVAAVFFNEACALAVGKQEAAAFKALRASIEYGWGDLVQLQGAEDLQNLRKHPEFAKLVKFARDKRKQDLKATISSLFIGKPDYQFDFKLDDTAGKPLAKQDFAGKLLIVNIWGTWCPPCRAELPDLIAAAKKYKSQGVEIVGINTESQNGVTAVELIKESQKRFGINYRCALGDEKTFDQIPDFGSVPMTLFFNRQGELQAQWIGQADEIVLEMIIERLLEESPPAKT